MIGKSKQLETLASFADQMTDIVWKVDQGGSIGFGNKHWLRFSGTSDVVNSGCTFPLKEFVHHEDFPKLQAIWEKSRDEGAEFSMEVRLFDARELSYVWHLMRAWPVLKGGDPSTLEQGQVWKSSRPIENEVEAKYGQGDFLIDRSGNRSDILHWLIICSDVHALKSTQTMFQLVMDNIPISIFWKDRKSSYLGCNKSFASDVGVNNSDELVGRNDYDNPSTREQSEFYVQCDKRVMDSGKPEYHIVETQMRPGGVQAWLDTNKIPLRNAGGAVVGVLGMYEDITKRVLLEQQREDFVATLTHDLKNPLLGTNQLLQFLVDGRLGPLADNQKDILQQLKDSNVTLISLIQNLLDVYKYENVAVLSEHQEVDLREFLARAVERYQAAAGLREIKLRLRISGPSQTLNINTQAMNRVLQNLIDNALKFVSPKGHIDVKACVFEDSYSIEVADDGPGIEIDDQQKLFCRYAQGASGKQISSGTGLGLYLCKQIVEAHKGSITCRSKPGHGASFTIVLPLS